MIQSLLELFTTEAKATEMLANPIIEFIFLTLFLLFIITVIVHFTLFIKIKNIRNYVKSTSRLDIEPLQSLQREFTSRTEQEQVQIDTFIQEKISSWHVFRIPIVSLLKMIQMTISVFILLGVLGTFIGLTISLGSIETSGDQLVENVAGVLSGIDVAFYTSIVGMGCSLIMTVLVRVFNTEYVLTDMMLQLESTLEGQSQHGIPQIIDISENIHKAVVHLQTTNEASLQGIVQAFDGFKDYTAGLQQSAKDLAAFNDGLADNLTTFQTLFEKMKTITDDFSSGTSELNKNFTTLFAYFKQSDERNERMLHTFEKTAETTQKVQAAQITSLTTFDTAVDDLKHFTTNMLEEQQTMHSTFDEIAEKMIIFTTSIQDHETALTTVMTDTLQPSLRELSKQMEASEKGFAVIGKNITTLPEALKVINDTHQANKTLLENRMAELTAFNETFSEHIQNHATESHTLDEQVRQAATSFEQMNQTQQNLLQEMNRAQEQMKNKFTERDQQLNTNVTLVKDTLTNYATNLEGTLGQKLDNIMRQFDNQTYQVNENMNREWADIRRLTEDSQQQQIRMNHQLLQDLTREIQTLSRQLSFIGNTPQQNRVIGPPPHEL